MRVLIGCESSGVVREAFRARGHDAYSCDLLPADDRSPWHIQDDVISVINGGRIWDLAIFHPPCTRLANSGVLRLYLEGKARNGVDETKWQDMEQAAAFFLTLWRAPIDKVAIENPILHGYAIRILGVQPHQIIQPYDYGHPESKATCLWLKNLPPLWPTKILPLPSRGYWDNQTASGQNRLSPSPDRWKKRARTYEGIATAMAEQWT